MSNRDLICILLGMTIVAAIRLARTERAALAVEDASTTLQDAVGFVHFKSDQS